MEGPPPVPQPGDEETPPQVPRGPRPALSQPHCRGATLPSRGLVPPGTALPRELDCEATGQGQGPASEDLQPDFSSRFSEGTWLLRPPDTSRQQCLYLGLPFTLTCYGAELCPPEFHVLKSPPPGPQNVTVCGDRPLKR